MSRRVLVTGASGFLGSALVAALESAGHEVLRTTRDAAARPGTITWEPAHGPPAARALDGVDAVVHLAGAPIGRRWSPAAKASIRGSRVGSTRLLAATLAGLDRPPRVFLPVSATGYYGDRGDEVLTESSAPGHGFLADLCREWEGAAAPATARGIRVVQPRIGLVLDARGGVLARLLPLFRLGMGGPLGDGRAWWSWIALEDLVAVLCTALEDERLRGPFNAVSPGCVRNREFARVLGRVLGRPALLPAPAFALRLLLGEMAEGALLASTRVEPVRLRETGFVFRHPDLEAALRALLAAGSARAGPGPAHGSLPGS